MGSLVNTSHPQCCQIPAAVHQLPANILQHVSHLCEPVWTAACYPQAAPLHSLLCQDGLAQSCCYILYRAGSRAALPTLPGGEITPIMMTALTQQAVRAVPSPQIILPSASGASPALSPAKPRPQLRIPRERRRQLASEDPLPLYLSVPSGPVSSQSHPFSSQLLSSSQVEREGVSWLLLPGWEEYDGLIQYGAALNTGELLHWCPCPCSVSCMLKHTQARSALSSMSGM